MDIIQGYIDLFLTGFEYGVALIGLPVMTGTAIGFLYKVAAKY